MVHFVPNDLDRWGVYRYGDIGICVALAVVKCDEVEKIQNLLLRKNNIKSIGLRRKLNHLCNKPRLAGVALEAYHQQ